MGFKIGNINIDSKIILAPMAGITDAAYMQICESFGVGYTVTELISAEAIIRNNSKTFDMLNGLKDLKKPYGIQIFGFNPKTMANAAKIIESKFNPSFIDINMGCPVPKVAIKNNAGSALLKNPNLVKEIVSSVVKSVNIPVTVKIRSGWDEKSINAIEIAKICEEAKAAAIAIHARTKSQGYSGTANWQIIKDVKDSVSIPVIGNGDIKTYLDAKKMLDETNCDAVMIGRALLGNPWLIKECNDYLNNSITPKEITEKEKIEMIKKHFNLLLKYKTEKQTLLEMRTHIMGYIKGLPNIKELKTSIMKANTKEDIFNILNGHLSKN